MCSDETGIGRGLGFITIGGWTLDRVFCGRRGDEPLGIIGCPVVYEPLPILSLIHISEPTRRS